MRMRKFTALAACVLILGSGTSQALDKDKFKTHFKKAFNLDPKMDITVGDPGPSQFGDLVAFLVTIGGQQQTVYMTKDERYYFWGMLLDLTTDPDKDRVSKINLDQVHMKGPKDAVVTVVEYSDIQCPNCQKAHSAVDEQLFKDFPSNVRLVFKHFPLGMHEWAEPAAVASECAAQQGDEAFWKMTDTLFKKGTEITSANLKAKATQFAADLKLDKAKYKACLEDPAILEKIRKDKKEGTTVGVNATPTFIVNGRMIRGNNYESVKAVIDEKLAEMTPKK